MSAPRIIPDSMRHVFRRVGPGPARRAKGLNLTAVVLNVHRPGERPDRKDINEDRNPGVTCEVLVYSPRHRCILDDVPILVQRAGVNDYSLWEPKASTVDVSGGSLSVEAQAANSAQVSKAEELDGDHVVIGFLNDDLRQPVILGQLPHPNTKRRPASDLSPFFHKREFVRGAYSGVTDDGDWEFDSTDAGKGEVNAQGEEQADAASGNLTLNLKQQAKLTITIDGTNTSIEIDGSLVKIVADGVEINNPGPTQKACRVGDATSGHNHTIAITGMANLTTGVVTATGVIATATDTMAQGSGTVKVGD
jgi:hypothetical protein